MRKFKKWYSSNGDFEILAVLILAEEWRESLQQHEGKNNKMYFNTAIVENQKKYFHLQVFSFIKNYLIKLSKV